MKRILVLFFLLSVSVSLVQAQCVSGDCENGKGTYQFKSGARYIGDFKDGKANGIGALYYSDGRRYVGQWKNFKQDGSGVMHFTDGKVWKGAWADGKFLDEPKTFTEIVEEPIVAEVIKEEDKVKDVCVSGNCNDGIGVYSFSNGSRYEGQMIENVPDGFGVFYYNTGDTLQGLWRAGQYKEDLLTAKGYGCQSGNCATGQGVYKLTDGSTYAGGFFNGFFDGYGICYYTNGEKYVGNWKNGTFEGYGIMYFSDGRKAQGTWRNGMFKENDEQLPDIEAEPVPFDPEIKVWAVVVGVAHYNHMPTLSYTDDDAYRLTMFLKSPEGGALPKSQIRVLIDEDATRTNIIKDMRATFGNADSNDVVLLYFSGHGLEGAFLPTDFDGLNNLLKHEDIKQLFNESAAKHKICIADACHSGSLKEFSARSSQSTAIIKSYYDAFAATNGGTALLLSSKGSETSLESRGLRQGIFSHFLIRGLEGEADFDNNKVVTIQELFDFVHKSVVQYTGKLQTPVLQGDFDPNMPIGVIGR